MADRDHPKTHVENDKDAELPRTQPESPQHEGIDPLTESDTMYPREDTKAESERLARGDDRRAAKAADAGENSDDVEKSDKVAKDVEKRNAKAKSAKNDKPAESPADGSGVDVSKSDDKTDTQKPADK